MSKATLLVRTTAPNPLALASFLRQEVPRERPGFRVSNIRTQNEIDRSQTVRERLLATLAFFFGGVALSLAGIGLYGVFDYSVVRRRREIGIRMAVGAQPGSVARLVTVDALTMVVIGAVAGAALGAAAARYIEALLYKVNASDPAMLTLPALTIVITAIIAAVPAVLHAIRIDPVEMLRAE